MVRQYVDMLAADQKVREATQQLMTPLPLGGAALRAAWRQSVSRLTSGVRQALNAVVRFYEEVLGRKVEGAEGYLRARSTDCLCRRLPASQALAGSLAAGCPGFAPQTRL